jgi:glycosyltransferase involved in cell wall biosynthesis
LTPIRRRKIAMLAPLPPTRSGIARHSQATARAIVSRDDCDVRIWSFRRQYPAWLYPGDSETSVDLVAPEDLTVSRDLDGVNPLSWWRCLHEIRAWKPDLVIYPVWTFFVAPALRIILGGIRRSGIETCAIVHNAFDHEARWWKNRLNLMAMVPATRFVTHNEALADQIRLACPGRKVSCFPHPVFDDFPAAREILPREAALELLFFGLVRPYKGLDVAIRALKLSGRQDCRLTIAGEFWHGLEDCKAQIRDSGLTDRIDLRPGYATDALTASLFERADAVVLPYRSVTGSGIVPLACHYGRGVLASDLPGLATTIRDGESGILFPAADPVALARVISGLTRPETTRLGQGAAAFGKTLGWNKFARLVLDQGESADNGAGKAR